MGNETRLANMDIVRGMGISLVVLGHNPICQHGHLTYALIFSFHMPLFFFLSGYFHKKKASLRDELISRAKRLLLPFYFTAFVYIALKCIPNPVSFFQNEFKPILFGVIWGSGGRGSLERYLFWPPLWFLTALFLTQAVYCLFSRIPILKKFRLSRALFYLFLLSFGVYYMETGGRGYFNIFGATLILSENGLPLNLDLVPITVFFYWLGAEYRSIKGLREPEGRTMALFLKTLSVLLVFSLLHFAFYKLDPKLYFQNVLDLNLRHYGAAMWSTVIAIVGIFSMLHIGVLLEKISRVKVGQLFMFIGRYSLPILIFHHFFQKTSGQLAADTNFWFLFLAFGIFTPILLSWVIISRSKILSRIYGMAPYKS